MGFVSASLDVIAAAQERLTGIGAVLIEANAAAAASTTNIAAAAADEVSTSIAALFGRHGQVYQESSVQAAAFHRDFTDALGGSARSYAAAESVNAQLNLWNKVNAPAQALLGRPLIGNGADATAPGAAGGDGGLLFGDGGAARPGPRPGRWRAALRGCGPWRSGRAGGSGGGAGGLGATAAGCSVWVGRAALAEPAAAPAAREATGDGFWVVVAMAASGVSAAG
ncbi:PE family protein [Mycobacterium kansasii 732]|nr:PE family protein [Mycobacterium kansasii 732]